MLDELVDAFPQDVENYATLISNVVRGAFKTADHWNQEGLIPPEMKPVIALMEEVGAIESDHRPTMVAIRSQIELWYTTIGLSTCTVPPDQAQGRLAVARAQHPLSRIFVSAWRTLRKLLSSWDFSDVAGPDKVFHALPSLCSTNKWWFSRVSTITACVLFPLIKLVRYCCRSAAILSRNFLDRFPHI